MKMQKFACGNEAIAMSTTQRDEFLANVPSMKIYPKRYDVNGNISNPISLKSPKHKEVSI